MTDSRKTREDNGRQYRWGEMVLVGGGGHFSTLVLHQKQSQTHRAMHWMWVLMAASKVTSQCKRCPLKDGVVICTVEGIKERQTGGARFRHFESKVPVDTFEEILRYRI